MSIAQDATEKRQRQINEKTGRILVEASRLFAAKGFHRTTTKEIAEAAGISEGALYNYFENKNDLLFGIMSRLANSQALAQQFERPESGTPRQKLETLLKQRKLFVEENIAMQQALLSEILANGELRQRYYQEILLPTIRLVESQLALAIEQQEIRAVEIPMTARYLVSLWNGFFLLQVVGDDITNQLWSDLVDHTAEIILTGIGSEKE